MRPWAEVTSGRIVYNYFRYYDPSTGRYITSDPIGLRGGLNTYGYVGGNPTAFTDVYGLSYWGLPGGLPRPTPNPGINPVPGTPGTVPNPGSPANDPVFDTIKDTVKLVGSRAIIFLGLLLHSSNVGEGSDVVPFPEKSPDIQNCPPSDPDHKDPCDELYNELVKLRTDILKDFLGGKTSEIDLEKLRRAFNDQVKLLNQYCPKYNGKVKPL